MGLHVDEQDGLPAVEEGKHVYEAALLPVAQVVGGNFHRAREFGTTVDFRDTHELAGLTTRLPDGSLAAACAPENSIVNRPVFLGVAEAVVGPGYFVRAAEKKVAAD